MSKRFTETEKWKDPWFRKLSPVLKCFWIYLLDNCNNAGIWNVDWELAEMLIGAKLDQEAIAGAFRDRIERFDDEYYSILGFIKYQYGELSEAVKPHRHVLQLLEKHGLRKGYPKGIHTLKDKDKDKGKDKDKDKDSAGYKIPDPAKEPAKCLVLTYKTLMGVDYQDRVWDQKQFGRAMAAAMDLLHFCKDLATSEKCLKEIGSDLDQGRKTWTLETVVKLAPIWLKKNGRTDANASRAGLRLAIAERRSKENDPTGLAKVSEGQIFNGLGNQPNLENRVEAVRE